MSERFIFVKAALAMAALAMACMGCRLDMHVQPKYLPYDESSFFADGRSERDPVPGAVARGHLDEDTLLQEGKVNGAAVDLFPFPVAADDLARGRERYNIFCSPCHDYTGSGQGMIVLRGFPRPPDFHIDRLRTAPAGHFVDVISNGIGKMHSYAARVPPDDRWRIAAYIRALQLSADAAVTDIPDSARQQLEESPR
jgi:mono/diheme cytochrome c family protein